MSLCAEWPNALLAWQGKLAAHFTQEIKGNSIGGLSITVAECDSLSLPARPDYGTHEYRAVVDFTGKGTSATKRCSIRLAEMAWGRGWACQP